MATVHAIPDDTAKRRAKMAPIHGPIMAIGGAERRDSDGEILKQFVHSAGRSKARVIVVPTASDDPKAGNDYVRLFRKMGAASAKICRITSREEANSDRFVGMISNATGIFISGGDQTRLTTLLVGTRASEAIRFQNLSGATVAGTSAGASILSTNMMANGDGDSSPRKGMTEMVSGIGLTSDVIMDQHFNARGRIGRLLVLFATSPGLIALGVDENTAAIISADGLVHTIGEHSVFVLDGRNVYSDIFDCKDGEVIAITGCNLHTMGHGRCFDLNERRVVDLIEEQTRMGDSKAT